MSHRTNWTRATTAGTAAMIAAISLTGCANALSGTTVNSANDLQPVTLMLNWTPNAHHAGIYYAEEHGFFEEAGIDLTIIEPGADVSADAAVAERKVEFGISQAESLLPARAAGMDLEAVATLLPVNDSVLMGLNESGLTEDPGSLAKLTYGGYGGALETEIISELVECGGGNASDVDFIDIGNVDYLSGLEQDRFDVTWVFGGWDALRASSERSDVVVLPLSEHEGCIPNWYTPIIIGNASEMADHPELTSDFLEATSRGYDAVSADPAAGADALLAGAPELDADLVTRAVDYYAPRFTAHGNFGVMEESVWERFGMFLVQAEMLSDDSVIDGSWTNEYLPMDGE